MEEEYKIPMEQEMREEVNTMCNLSQGIREDAREEMIVEILKNTKAQQA